MNEAENPYASPQADLGTTPFVGEMSDDLPGLRTTGMGLSLVYYGIILISLAIMGVEGAFLFPLICMPDSFMANLASITLAMSVTAIIGSLLVFSGQIVCLLVPSQTGAKSFVISAVFLQLIGMSTFFLPVVRHFFPNLRIPFVVPFPLNLCGLVSILFFVLFLGKLSKFLGRMDFMAKVRNVLIFGTILFLVYVVTWGSYYLHWVEPWNTLLPEPKLGILLVIILLIGGLICFVMYANLVNALRKVLLGKHPMQAVIESAKI